MTEATEPVEFVDLDWMYHLTRRRVFADDIGAVEEQVLEKVPLPEDLMTAIQDYVGDGQGRITVSKELSTNQDYCKAGSFVSISLACDNSLEAAEAVHDIAAPYAQKLVEVDHHEMSLMRDQFFISAGRKKSCLHQEEETPARKAAPSKTGGKKSGGKKVQRGGSITAPTKARSKPNVRR